MMKLLCLLLVAVSCFGQAPTFRYSITPLSILRMFNLPIYPGVTGDKLDVLITSAEADVYRVTVITTVGRVQRQIVERPTVPACPTCLPLATFWVEGTVERVIVEALMPGPAGIQLN